MTYGASTLSGESGGSGGNIAPVAEDDWYSTLHDTTLTEPAPGVLGNDWDDDGDPLTAVLDAGPSSGTLNYFNSDGSFEYVPNAGFVGQDSFTYHANDGTDDSLTATVTIDVMNAAPVASDDWYSILHDTTLTEPAPGVLGNDWDDDGDPIDAVLDTNPTDGTLNYFNSDGSFEYVPNAGFVGQDSFTYHVNDGIEDSTTATVTIDVTNEAPWAEDDFYDILFDPVTDPVLLDVTSNDFDPDGDPIIIISVTSTEQGANVWIASSSLDIWYELPSSAGSNHSIGGVVYPDDMPTTTEPAGTDGGEWANFEDSFSYTIEDDVSATDTAVVQVAMQNVPKWRVRLLKTFDEAAEVGVDGDAGYDLKIRQTFGEKAPNLQPLPKTQIWQRVAQDRVHIAVDTNGEVKKIAGDRILADTDDVGATERTPLKQLDHLKYAPGEKIDDVALMLETRDMKLGFNKLGATLPVPDDQPWEVTKQEHKDLIDQINPNFDILTNSSEYVYVNKPLLEQLHNDGQISDDEFDAIKNTLQNDFGVDYATIPDKYEKYTLGDLGSWESP